MHTGRGQKHRSIWDPVDLQELYGFHYKRTWLQPGSAGAEPDGMTCIAAPMSIIALFWKRWPHGAVWHLLHSTHYRLTDDHSMAGCDTSAH